MNARAARSKTQIYLLMVFMESLAALTVLWCMIPTYRVLWASLGQQLLELPETPVPLVAALVLFHCIYWYRLARVPLVMSWHSMVVSHFVLFLGRLSFICASAFFALAIFRHLPSLIYIADMTLLIVRVSATFVILVSFYCYSSELERLGIALRPAEAKGTA